MEVSLKGIIAPADWDSDFNVTAIKISTEEEKEFLVERDFMGKKLFNHIRELVGVEGVINVDKKGHKIITVREFEVLDQF